MNTAFCEEEFLQMSRFQIFRENLFTRIHNST